jgi:RNA polymerase sigma-70 factor (ECF subfamily)
MDEVFTLPKPFSLNIDEARRGDPSAEEIIADLYVKLRPAMVSYIYHLIGSTRDAEDIVQIAFIQLFDQLNNKKDIRNVRGWLYKVARNFAIESVRSADRRETLFRNWFGESQQEVSSASIEQDLIQQEQIAHALAGLSEKERDCLMLRAEGLSYKEIADVLETTAKSVSVYLARGLKKFESNNEDERR